MVKSIHRLAALMFLLMINTFAFLFNNIVFEIELISKELQKIKSRDFRAKLVKIN
jgi:hypothetical protein